MHYYSLYIPLYIIPKYRYNFNVLQLTSRQSQETVEGDNIWAKYLLKTLNLWIWREKTMKPIFSSSEICTLIQHIYLFRVFSSLLSFTPWKYELNKSLLGQLPPMLNFYENVLPNSDKPKGPLQLQKLEQQHTEAAWFSLYLINYEIMLWSAVNIPTWQSPKVICFIWYVIMLLCKQHSITYSHQLFR